MHIGLVLQEAGWVVQFVGESKKGQWEGQAEAVDRNSPAFRVSCELMCNRFWTSSLFCKWKWFLPCSSVLSMAPTGMGTKREEELETAKYRKLFFEEFYSKEKQRNGMVARGECGRKVCYCFKVHLLGLLWWLSSKESTCNTGDAGNAGVIPGFLEDFWRRAWEPTLEFLLGKSHRQRSLVGYGPWGRKESDTSESTEQSSMCWWEWSSGEKDWWCWRTAGVMLLSTWEGRIGLRWERSVGKAAGGAEEWVGADADSWESVQVTSSLLTVVELSLSSRQHHQRACVGGEVGEAGTLRMTEKLWYSLLGEWIDRKCCMIAVPVVVGSLRACWKSVGWNLKWDQPALCFPPALELG